MLIDKFRWVMACVIAWQHGVVAEYDHTKFAVCEVVGFYRDYPDRDMWLKRMQCQLWYYYFWNNRPYSIGGGEKNYEEEIAVFIAVWEALDEY